MTNVELLKRELWWLLDHPERHDQGTWISGPGKRPLDHGERWHCNTTACLAGWVAIHAGWMPEPKTRSEESVRVTHPDRTRSHEVSFVARMILDLEPNDAYYLFNGGISLMEMFEYANDITDGAIEIPYDRFDDDGDPMPLTTHDAGRP